ncbi:MAG: NADPH-dependent 7-cyano-7-deazaguanine reductase QueF [Gammaproteobacteria bacterium]|nr:NADPH-dependent 7-cyano-7-deazaguanine reductase QueF [Gammaproteobacteria bacterium]
MTTESPLGQPSTYLDQYAPELLHPIARASSRDPLGLAEPLPFAGVDIWNAWELTWLDTDGKPAVATAEIRFPASSTNIVESKSLKLYLNSFSMSRYVAETDVAESIEQDLSACVDADVDVCLRKVSALYGARIARPPGDCLDGLNVQCDAYEVDTDLLQADENDIVQEDLYTHLLRSLCPVTNQPDCGSLLIAYRGPRIDRKSLLRYIVSYREHNDFHEACVERMFVDVLERCRPEELTVYARYQRRGGIDINPFRSNFEKEAPNIRLWRQ